MEQMTVELTIDMFYIATSSGDQLLKDVVTKLERRVEHALDAENRLPVGPPIIRIAISQPYTNA